MHIYIYIYRGRERERERDVKLTWCILFKNIYIYFCSLQVSLNIEKYLLFYDFSQVGYMEVCITAIILINVCLVNNYIEKHT